MIVMIKRNAPRYELPGDIWYVADFSNYGKLFKHLPFIRAQISVK